MNNFLGCSSKMLKKKNTLWLFDFPCKCHDFETELHFAGVKLGEEKRKLFNQIKMTLSRFEC